MPAPARATAEPGGASLTNNAGGVINDHHGVGSTLAPYLERQWGPAYGTLLQIKQALDPANVMNPGKLGFPIDGADGGSRLRHP